MWIVPGEPVSLGILPRLVPDEVFYEFDIPMTFTARGEDGSLFLVHWCDEDAEILRFVVTTTSDLIVKRLKSGHITLREGLDQAWTWVYDIGRRDGEKRGVWRVSADALPAKALPYPEVMLFPELAHPSTPCRPGLS